MAKLEKFVRQVEQTAAPRRIATESITPVEPVILKIGRGGGGSGRTMSSSYSASYTLYCEAHRNEPEKKSGFSLATLSRAFGPALLSGPGDEPEGIYRTHRKWHMHRFYAEHPDPNNPKVMEREDDVWVDVQRIDEIIVSFAPDYQKYTYHVKWYDDDDRTKDNPTRKIKKVKVKNPDDNEQFVEVPAPEASGWFPTPYVAAREFAKEEFDAPDVDKPILNDPWWMGQLEGLHIVLPSDEEDGGGLGEEEQESLRYADLRRVIHRDVEAEPDEDGFFQPGTYVLVEDKDGGDKFKDKDQYINFAFPLRIGFRDTPQRLYQVNYFNLKQKYLLDFFEPMDRKDEKDEKKKPVWLDPFQNIINVQWGGLAVDFGDKAGPPPEKKK